MGTCHHADVYVFVNEYMTSFYLQIHFKLPEIVFVHKYLGGIVATF